MNKKKILKKMKRILSNNKISKIINNREYLCKEGWFKDNNKILQLIKIKKKVFWKDPL